LKKKTKNVAKYMNEITLDRFIFQAYDK